jgi:hypothetical protein
MDEEAKVKLAWHVVRSEVREAEKAGGKVQSVIFDSEKWTLADAKAWLKDHDFASPKVDETENSYRFRQAEPGGFKRFVTKKVPGVDGVKFVIGWTE